MKRSLILAVAVAAFLLSACAHSPADTAIAPQSTPTTDQLTATAVASGPVNPEDMGPPPINPAPPEVTAAAEISDDPLVGLIANFVKPDDVARSLAINAADGDKIQPLCTKFISDPATLERARTLLSFKAAAREFLSGNASVLQIAPIVPIGPISALAEARRVIGDVTSGQLAERLLVKRKELADLVVTRRKALLDLEIDTAIACAPLLTDVKFVGRKLAAIVLSKGVMK